MAKQKRVYKNVNSYTKGQRKYINIKE